MRVSRNHRRAGLVYVWGMTAALASAYPLAVMLPSVFLGAVALFTTYLVASGWRWIRRGQRRGTRTSASRTDRAPKELERCLGVGDPSNFAVRLTSDGPAADIRVRAPVLVARVRAGQPAVSSEDPTWTSDGESGAPHFSRS